MTLERSDERQLSLGLTVEDSGPSDTSLMSEGLGPEDRQSLREIWKSLSQEDQQLIRQDGSNGDYTELVLARVEGKRLSDETRRRALQLRGALNRTG